MAWVKLDDQFFTRAKAQRAGKDGRALYLAGLCFCAANLTDGEITTDDLPFVAASAGVKPALAGRLVEVELWERTERGYQVHDFLEYNPPAEQVKADRKKDRERKQEERRRGGKAKPSGRNPSGRPPGHRPESGRNPEVPSRPVPLPIPTPGENQEPSSSSENAREDDDDVRRVLEDLWPFMAYRRMERRRRSEPIRDKAAYVRTTTTVLASQFTDEVRRLLAAGRGPALEELAELLEAGEATGVPTSTFTDVQREPCARCESSGLIEVDDRTVERCPDCNPARVSA